MSSELMNALRMVADERSIAIDDLIAAISEAVTTAAAKRLERENLEAEFSEEKGEFDLYENLEVVEEVTDPILQISLEQARAIDPDAGVGKAVRRPVENLRFRP